MIEVKTAPGSQAAEKQGDHDRTASASTDLSSARQIIEPVGKPTSMAADRSDRGKASGPATRRAYKSVGEAYVRGIMRGEAVKAMEADGKEWEEICIV